jgi:hypothetical protein
MYSALYSNLSPVDGIGEAHYTADILIFINIIPISTNAALSPEYLLCSFSIRYLG